MIFKIGTRLLSTLRNLAKFPLFKDADDLSWPRNGSSWSAKQHTALV